MDSYIEKRKANMSNNLRNLLIGILVLLVVFIGIIIAFPKLVGKNTSKQSTTHPISSHQTTAGEHTPNALMGKPALWKASKDGVSFWLFGSYHAAPTHQETHNVWMNDAFLHLFQQANKIYFEADAFSLEGQKKLAGLIQKKAFLPKGTTLEDILETKDYQALQRYLERLKYPLPPVSTMKPWMVMIFLTQLEMAQHGFSVEMGIDKILYKTALKEKKDIDYLETPEQSLAVLYQMDKDQQIKALQAMVNLPEEKIKDMHEKLYQAWETGDIETIGALIKEETRDTPELWDALYKVRNKDWVKKLTKGTQTGQNVLIVVGAAHMTGEFSLQHLLEQKGYRVKRVAY